MCYFKMLQDLQVLILTSCLYLVSQAADVIQDPRFIVSSPMKNISVTCKHDDSSKYTKSWYRQEKTKGPILMGYTNYVEKASMEPGFNDGRIEIKPESSQKSILTITEVSTQDSAVYYCASSVGRNSAAYFGAGTALSVLEEGKEQKKPDVSIYRPKKRELEDNNFISLVCVASNFFPEHVKIRWFVNSEERINLYEPVPQKNADDSYSTSKRLTLTREEYFNPDTTFRCVAAFLDGTLEASEEIKGETDCGVSKEFYTMYINQGKISYIMVLCKSGLYALVVLVLVWRKKVIAHSY